jgi:beta-glucosidase
MLRPAPEVAPPGAWSEPQTAALAHPVSGPAGAAAADPDLALLLRLRHNHVPVVAVFLTGRPRGVTAELDASTAFVVAWLPGSEGGGVADVLFRSNTGDVNFDFTGKLSFDWPRGTGQGNPDQNEGGGDTADGRDSPLYPYGFGLTYCIPHCDAPLSRGLWRTQPSSMSQNTPASR